MRQVMALRVCKAVLVFAIALFYTFLVLNNLTDYGSNYEFVRHVLMMDSTFPGNHVMWRAANSPLVHTLFYIGIIVWESVTMLLSWWAGVWLLKSYRADRVQFAAALDLAMIALTTSLLMWLVAFLDVGGEWFLMWQSKMWNGQEEAFRMFTIVGVVFLVVVQREPTPDYWTTRKHEHRIWGRRGVPRLVFFGLAVMTISSAPFRHDVVFLEEHFAPPSFRNLGTNVAACARCYRKT